MENTPEEIKYMFRRGSCVVLSMLRTGLTEVQTTIFIQTEVLES